MGNHVLYGKGVVCAVGAVRIRQNSSHAVGREIIRVNVLPNAAF